MTLREPTSEDLQKLHAEITQVNNQRFLLTTFAVTVFALITAWLIPGERPVPGSRYNEFTFIASMLLTVLLFLLFLLNYLIQFHLRNLSTYLIVTGKSCWESDWERFRAKKPYVGLLVGQTIVFLVLGVLSTVYPILVAVAFRQKIEPRDLMLSNIFLGLVYVALVVCLGFLKMGGNEKTAKHRWEWLKNKPDAT